MAQIIRKAGRIYCRTATDYQPETIKQMKRAGYTVTEDRAKTQGENGGRKK